MAAQKALLRPREKKAREIELLEKMFRENAVVMVLDLTRTSTNVLQRFRSSFRGRATIRVAKKTLDAIAAERAGRKALAELLKGLKVPVGFIATDVNPFRLKLEIDRGDRKSVV